MCVNADAAHFPLENSGIFGVMGVTMAGKDADKVRELLEQAVADVVKNGVTPDELDKAKTNVRYQLIQGRKTATDLAAQLAEEAVKGGDANRVNIALAKVEALTPADVQKVAAKYLVAGHETALITKPSLMAAVDQAVAASQAAAVKDAPVAASTAPIAPRVTEFPKDYPTTAPSADPKKAPEFAKGTESDIDGVKVIVMPDHRLPLVDWSVTMRRGSQSDPVGKEGLAWLTAEMLRRGVKGMNFEALTKDLDSRAISIGVGDGGDVTRLNGSAMTDQLDHAIERSRQILMEPTFPADEFSKLKEQSINNLQVEQESPGTVAGNDLTRALYGESPIGRYATPASLKSVTLDDVKAFYAANYRPNDAVVIVCGDVTVERGRELAKKLIEGWKPGELAKVEIDLPPVASKRKIILVDRPQGKQATVRMGIRAFDLHSDEKYPGSIASQVLSSGIESRLGRYVRAEKGLAYGVTGVFRPNRQAGAFIGSTDTAIESTAAAVQAMFEVFDKMRKEDVTPAELAEAKMRVAGRMVMDVQTIGQQAGYRVDGILNGYPIDYYDKYPARVAEVTPAQIRDVMNKYVKDDAMTIVVVAPAKLVRAQLEKLGEVEVVPMPAQREAAATQPAKKAA
jgi:zinc protease